MKILLLFFAINFLVVKAYNQENKYPVKHLLPNIPEKFITPITASINEELEFLKEGNKISTDEEIKFCIDTVTLEKFVALSIDEDYKTSVMVNATYDAAKGYFKLIDRYYKLILGRLNTTDKKVLINNQNSWLSFLNNEKSLFDILRKDKYSGGGSMQSTTSADRYFNVVKARAIELFTYYLDMENK